MITLVDKTPVAPEKHREYMRNAHRIDASIVVQRIRRSNPKLYMEMGSPATDSKKLKWDPRMGQMVFNPRPVNIEAYATPTMYIVKYLGTTYYMMRNGL